MKKKKKAPKEITILPITKHRNKTGCLKITPSGYLVNKNGKLLPLRTNIINP